MGTWNRASWSYLKDLHKRTVETIIGEAATTLYCANCKDIVGDLCDEVNVLVAQRGNRGKKGVGEGKSQ